MSNVVPFRKHGGQSIPDGLRDLADRIERGELDAEGVSVFVQQSLGGSYHALRFGQTYPLTLLGAIQYITLRWVEESQ